jgi:hypothetical protein
MFTHSKSQRHGSEVRLYFRQQNVKGRIWHRERWKGKREAKPRSSGKV